MKFTLEINMDNAAFQECGIATELGAILGNVMVRLHEGELPPFTLRGSNGNTVGQARIEE